MLSYKKNCDSIVFYRKNNRIIAKYKINRNLQKTNKTRLICCQLKKKLFFAEKKK